MFTLVIRYRLGRDLQSKHGISLVRIVGAIESLILFIHLLPAKYGCICLLFHIYRHFIECVIDMLGCRCRSNVVTSLIAGEQISGLCRTVGHLLLGEKEVIELSIYFRCIKSFGEWIFLILSTRISCCRCSIVERKLLVTRLQAGDFCGVRRTFTATIHIIIWVAVSRSHKEVTAVISWRSIVVGLITILAVEVLEGELGGEREILRHVESKFTAAYGEVGSSELLCQFTAVISALFLTYDIDMVDIRIKSLQGNMTLNNTCTDYTNLHGIVVQTIDRKGSTGAIYSNRLFHRGTSLVIDIESILTNILWECVWQLSVSSSTIAIIRHYSSSGDCSRPVTFILIPTYIIASITFSANLLYTVISNNLKSTPTCTWLRSCYA